MQPVMRINISIKLNVTEPGDINLISASLQSPLELLRRNTETEDKDFLGYYQSVIN